MNDMDNSGHQPETTVNIDKKDFDELMFQLRAYKRECADLRNIKKAMEIDIERYRQELGYKDAN